MRTQIVWLTAIFIVLMGFGLSRGQEVVNILENGGFETGDMAPWSTYGPGTSEVVTELTGAAVPEAPIEGTHALHITIPSAGANFWDAGLQHGGHVFESGKKYTLSAFLKTKSGELNINFKPELAQDPWDGYGAQAFTMTEEWTEFSTTTPVFTADVNPASITFHIQYDVGDFWVDGVRWYEGDYVPPAFKPVVEAADPSPADGAVNVAQDVILGWSPGPTAAVHDVYFGTSFDDVNDAPTMNTLDKLVSNDQPGTTYDPDGLLDFGETYYWRIDEVNAPPDSTVFKGAVWSFTVEPFAFPITSVTATASSENTADMAAGKTVDGSGLAGDLHSVEPTDMWLSSVMPTAPQPTSIQFEFDQSYNLLEMWVWNSNQLLEPVIGFGVQDVTVEHSEDGQNWTSLGDVQIPRAPGTAGNAHDATISLAGVTAKFVRLTISSNWGGIVQQFGLSEVRFFFIPVEASDPAPADGDSGVGLDTTLSWRSGREVASHEVYFSNDKAAVEDGTALVDTVSEGNFDPGTLEYGQIYYWKVNEVNDAAAIPVREGEVWEFSTVENFIVEDFESYSAENPIWETWLDGLGFGAAGTPGFNPGNGTGSAVGDDTTGSFTEETIVNSGGQSMPLFYDNSKAGAANYSETERTFAQAQDWTTGGVSQLSLWFIGIATNAAEPLYIGLADSAGNSATLVHEDPAAAQADSFTLWPVDLADFADQGVNIASVEKLILGLGNPAAPIAGGAGTMYFDDIAVGNPVQVPPVDSSNLLVNGGFEDGIADPWSTYGDATLEVVQDLAGAAVPEAPVEGSSSLHVTVNSAGANFWDGGLQHGGHVFEAGKSYTLSVWFKSKSGSFDINIKPERAADPWEGYGSQEITITEDWAEYTVNTGVIAETVDPASLTFHIAYAPGEFWVDAARWYEGDYVPTN